MMLDALTLGLDARTKVAQLSHTTITADELFELLVSEFGLEDGGGGKLERLGRIQGFLDQWTAAGRNSVLVVDEAQNLSLALLEEIRLLSNLRSQGQCSLQIVLAGQPEFRELLDRDELRQLKQRIGIRYHLTPLSAGETAEYVSHRLSVAGSDEPIFDKGALEAVYAYAGGVPRMINILCDRALVAGYGANKRRIGKALIAETVGDLQGAGFSATKDAVAPEIPASRRGEPRPDRPAEEPVREQVAARPAPVNPPEPAPSEAAVGQAPGKAEPRSAAPARAERRPRERSRPRPRRERAQAGVVGASVANRRVPTWTLPAVVVVGALAVVAFSGIRTEWWRGADGGPGERTPAVSAVAEEAPGGTQADPSSEGGTDAVSSVAGAVGDIVDTSVDAASAGEAGEGAGGGDDRTEAGDEPTAASGPAGAGEVEPDETGAAQGEGRQERPGAGAAGEADARADGPAPGAALTSGPGGPFRAVALSSRNADAAREEAVRLMARGFAAEVIPVDLGDGSIWNRVVVTGGFPSLESARVAVEALKRLGYDGAWVHRE